MLSATLRQAQGERETRHAPNNPFLNNPFPDDPFPSDPFGLSLSKPHAPLRQAQGERVVWKTQGERGGAGRASRGFTLIELLITVAILAVLASGAMAVAELATRRSQEQELRAALRQIREAIDAYKVAADAKRIAQPADASGYPPQLTALTQGVPDAGNATGKKLYFLRRLPRDPLADPALPAEATWGLRSYESDVDNPQPGRDVFDVYSLSPKQSLGGRPYREW